jgi:autotransporter-associated beta strand protein
MSSPLCRRPAVLLLLAATLGPVAPAQAQTQTWNNPFGGDPGSAYNWSPPGVPVSGTGTVLNFNLYDLLGYTANNGIGALTVNSLTFGNAGGLAQSGSFTLSGNTITLDAAGTGNAFVTNNAQGTVTISAPIIFGTTNPNMALVFNGTGTGTTVVGGTISGSGTNGIVINTNPLGVTQFTGANGGYGGTTTLTQGILSLGNVNALGASNTNTITVNGPNTILNFALPAAGTVPNDITLAGGNLNLTGNLVTNTLTGTVSGTGSLVLNSGLFSPTNTNNSFSGDVRVFGGRLVVTSSVPTAGNNSVLGAGNAIQIGRTYGAGGLNGNAQLFLDGSLNATGALSGAEMLVTAAGVTISRPITVNAGSTGLVSIGNTSSSIVTYDTNATITLNRPLLVYGNNPNSINALNGDITGTGGLSFTLGTAQLNGNNTYSGGTMVDNTSIALGSSNALGTGPVLFNRLGGTLSASNGPVTITNPVYASTNVVIGLTATSAFSLNLTGSNNITFAQPLTGTGLVFAGMTNATITLQGATNTISSLFSNGAPTGTTTIDLVGNTLNIGFSNFTINSTIGYYGALTSTGGGGQVVKYGANTQGFTGQVGVDKLIAHQGVINIFSITTPTVSDGTFSGSSLVANSGAAIQLDNTNNVVNRFTAATPPPLTLNGGTLLALGNATLPTAQAFGPLNLSGFSTTTVTPGAAGTTLTFDSLVRTAGGGGALRGRGTGLGNTPGAGVATVLFTTAPTLSGGPGVAGTTTLPILPYAVSGTTTTDVGNSFLTYDPVLGLRPLSTSTEYAAYTGANAAADNVRVAGAPALPLAGQAINSLVLDNTGTVGMIVPGTGTLTIGAAPATTAGLLLASSAATPQPLGVNGFTAIDFGTREAVIHATDAAALGSVIASTITGSGGLTKSGAGILYLAAPNPGLTGPVVVGGGTLYVGNDNQLGPITNPVVLNGGTLQYATGLSGAFPRPLQIGPGGGTLNVGANTSITVSGITALPGQVAGSLIKDGQGTLTLTGANAIGDAAAGGRVAVRNGVLSIPDDSVLGAAPFLSFEVGSAVGATLRITGAAVTFNKPIVFSGSSIGAYFDIPSAGSTVTLAAPVSGGNAIAAGTTFPTEFAKVGAGTLVLTNTNTFWGPITVLQGNLQFQGSGTALLSTGTSNATTTSAGTQSSAGTYVGFGSTLTLDNTGTNVRDRLSDSQAVRLQNGEFRFLGNASTNSTETLGAVVLESGSFSTFTIVPGAGQYANVGAMTFSTTTAGTATTNTSAGLLVRGPNLGQVPVAGTTTAGLSLVNMTATSVYPALQPVGGGGARGTTTISILPGVIGDNDPAGLGNTFVTYEGPNGLATGMRALTPAEFGSTVRAVTGSVGLSSENVRLSGAAPVSEVAAVNSLLLTGSGGTSGSGTLAVTSGNVLVTAGSTGTLANTGGLLFGVTGTGAVAAGPSTTATFVTNADLTVTAPIYGATANTFGLLKAGPGNLTLNAVNAFAGTVSVAGGTLTLGPTGTLNPASTVNVLQGATFNLGGVNRTVGNLTGSLNALTTNLVAGGGTVDATGATLTVGMNNGSGTFAGVIQGAGANLVRTGTVTGGSLTLIAPQTYTGSTTIANGTLVLWGLGGSLPATSAINVTGGTLQLNNQDMQGTAGFNTDRVPNATPVSLSGALVLNANPNVQTTETLGVTAAGFNFQGGATVTVQPGAGTLIAPARLTLGVPASGVVNRTNNATVLFRGTNLGVAPYAAPSPAVTPVLTGVFPGSTNVFFTTAPTGLVGGGGAAGSTNMSIIPWAVGDTSPTGVGSSFVTYDPAAGVRPLNTNAALGVVEYADGTAVVIGTATTSNVRLTSALSLTGPGTATINALNNTGVAVTGTGGATISLTSGAFLNSNAPAAPFPPVTFSANLDFGASEGVVFISSVNSFQTISGIVSGSNGLTKGGAGNLTLTAANTYSGGTTVGNGTLQISADTQLGANTGPTFGRVQFSGPYGGPTLLWSGTTAATLSRDLAFTTGSGTINYAGTTADLTLAGSPLSTNKALSGPGALIKTGAGRVIIADNDNTGAGGFTGQVRIDAGTLRVTRDVNLGSGGDLILNGGTLELAGAAAAFTTTRSVYVTAASTLQLAGGAVTLNGPVSGTGAFTLTVSSGTAGGALTIGGNNTGNLAYAVNSGAVLRAASNTALGLNTTAQAVTVNSGAALELTGGINITSKAIALNGTGLSSSPNGALRSVSGVNSSFGPVTLSTDSTIQVDAGGRLNLYGPITGAVNLTKQGAGVLNVGTPAGNPAFTGNLTVTAGTFLANNQVGAAAGAVTVQGGATVGGSGAVTTLTVGTGGAIISPGNAAPGVFTVNGTAGNVVALPATGTTVRVEVNAPTGTPGVNWDLVRAPNNGTNSIDLTGQAVTVQLASLTPANAPGPVTGFNPAAAASWPFAVSSGGFTGFNPANFTVDSSQFTNNTFGGTFAVTQPDANTLAIMYTPVPEPATVLLVGAVGLAAGGFARRRRAGRA